MQYENFYKSGGLNLLGLREERNAYLEAYKMLVNPNARTAEFNDDAIILNTVKCSTSIEWHKLPKLAKEEAKNNCICYLTRQLEAIQPKVILSHGKFTCCTIINMLRNGTKYTVVSTSRDIDTLAKEIHTRPNYIDEISKEYVIAKNGNEHKTLFLFNWHLSRYWIAVNSLKKNIEGKKRIVNQVLSMPK